MKKNFPRNCDNCDNTLNHNYKNSPCRKCLSCRGLNGWKPMRLRTRLRVLWRRAFR